jgi:hypothetical protein
MSISAIKDYSCMSRIIPAEYLAEIVEEGLDSAVLGLPSSADVVWGTVVGSLQSRGYMEIPNARPAEPD